MPGPGPGPEPEPGIRKTDIQTWIIIWVIIYLLEWLILVEILSWMVQSYSSMVFHCSFITLW
ncbi:uncharacterized protein Dwil_GK26922 [Drosophila willistoni]|uniref:Uncharacterized protein n=1 Tax=Drosophila willistoni TaxID=7260 RepID=A0A0Q9WTP2_DROWI|nr:uncharacterized protein Dwil_GK26922 [Drosophila willistoni]